MCGMANSSSLHSTVPFSPAGVMPAGALLGPCLSQLGTSVYSRIIFSGLFNFNPTSILITPNPRTLIRADLDGCLQIPAYECLIRS